MVIVEAVDFERPDVRCRWVEMIRLIYEVDPLVCPKCGGTMRLRGGG